MLLAKKPKMTAATLAAVLLIAALAAGCAFSGAPELPETKEKEGENHSTVLSDGFKVSQAAGSAGIDAPENSYAADLPDSTSSLLSADPVVSYDNRVSSEEVVLQNGVRLRMSYDEVAALAGYDGEAPSLDADWPYFSFELENIVYSFHQNDAGELLLSSVGIGVMAMDASAFRNIKVGDSIESVFSKIPAQDTELKQWAEQTLYGSDPYDEAGYAKMEFVAMSFYSITIYTPESVIDIKFTHDDICVQWINISDRAVY